MACTGDPGGGGQFWVVFHGLRVTGEDAEKR